MSIQVFGWVLDHSTAEKSARLVLFALANHADRDGTKAFPSVETLCREARLSRRSVQNALRSLEAGGHIEITGTTAKGTTIYRILMGGRKICAGAQPATPDRSEIAPEPSLEPSFPSGGVVARARGPIKYNGKPVNAESWALTEQVLAEYNRQAGSKLRLVTSAGQPSEAAKRVYGRVRAYPDIDLEEHGDIIRRTLESHWWDGETHIGVVYGPKVFEVNITRSPARQTNQHQKDDELNAKLREMMGGEAA